MSETLDLILQTADKLFAQHCDKELINQAEKGQFADDLWQQIEETGLLLAGVPEQYDGVGGEMADFFRLLELAGKHCIPLPLAETYIARLALYEAGIDVPDGPLSFAQAGAAIPFGRFSNGIVLWSEHELRYFPTINQSFIEGYNYAGEADDRIDPKQNDGVTLKTQHNIEWWRGLAALSRSSLMSGALEFMLDNSVSYALERKQFGRPIAKFQAIQQQLAVLAGQYSQARQATRVAALNISSSDFMRSVAVAKSVTGEAAGIGSEISHQVMGAMGFTYEHDLHHRSRRLWSWRDQWGNEAQWNIVLGKQLAATDPDQLWALLTT